MLNHVIVVEAASDKDWAVGAGTALTAQEYVGEPQRFESSGPRGPKVRVINPPRTHSYSDARPRRAAVTQKSPLSCCSRWHSASTGSSAGSSGSELT